MDLRDRLDCRRISWLMPGPLRWPTCTTAKTNKAGKNENCNAHRLIMTTGSPDGNLPLFGDSGR